MATYYLRIAFNVNGGHVQNESTTGAAASNFYYSAGLTSYTSYTASTSYKYFKGTGAVTGCAKSGGTYATHYQRIASTTTYPNLVNVATFNIVRDGYHIVGTSAYRTTATGGKLINQDYSSSSTTNPATYAKLGGSTSANKTVTIYVNWVGNSYTINYSSNGGTGTTASSSHVYGTAKALTSNGFTRTGYTFNGWSTTPSGEGRWEEMGSFSCGDEEPSYAATALKAHYQALYGYWNNTWYKWDDGDFVSTTAPPTYINGSSTYTSCSPTPTKSGGFSYLSMNGRTYCLGLSHSHSASDDTDHYSITLYRWNPGQSFSNGASITTLQSCPANGGTITLYAQWTPNNYYVLLDDNAAGGDGTGLTTLTMTYGTNANNSITPPTRFGHTFDGYYDIEEEIVYNSSGNAVVGSHWKGTWTTVFTVRGTGPCRADHIGTDGTYLYLKYNSQYYQVSVNNSNSYTLLSSEPSCNWKADHEPIAYQGFNYYFNPAYATTTQNYVVYIYRYVGTSGATWKSTSNIPLVAKWVPKVKSFKLDPNGGVYNGTTGTTTKTVTYGTSENSNVGVPTRAGYRFDGWYYSTGSSQQIFDSTGNAISDALNGPWYNASPTSLASGAKYIHYGDYIWGIYANSSTGLHVCLWEGDEWEEKMTDSVTTNLGDAFPKGLGKLIVIVVTVNQNMYCAVRSADADIWSGGISTLFTPLYSYPIFGEIPYSGSSTTLPNEGKIWLYDNSTTPVPTYYAHWTPKIYVKQNGSWVGGSPQINASGTWKSPTSAYVKVNGTWKQIY